MQARLSQPFALLAVLLTAFATNLAASASTGSQTLKVIYQHAGQVCVGASDEQAFAAALVASEIPQDAQVTITAYSDRVELRNPNRLPRTDCVLVSVPSDFKGHERLAALRALNVIDIARRSGIAAFNRPPFFMRGIQNDIRSESRLIVQCERTLSEGSDPRRVEIRWTRVALNSAEPPKCDNNLPIAQAAVQASVPVSPLAPPLPPATNLIPQNPIVIMPPDKRINWRRPVGWSSFVIGSVTIALSVAFFGAGGSMENRSLQSLDQERRQFFTEQANDYYRGGGGAAAVGTGLVGVGIYLLVTGRSEGVTGEVRKSVQGIALDNAHLSFAGTH